MVAFTGRANKIDSSKFMDEEGECLNFNDSLKGRCFLKYKCDEMEKLEIEVKELYTLVNPNKTNDNNNKMDLDDD